MNKKTRSLWVIVLVLAAVGLADAQADKKTKFVYPKSAFDQAAAKNTLEKGKSTISGIAYTRVYDAKIGENVGAVAVRKKEFWDA